jgi:hypothetical protein
MMAAKKDEWVKAHEKASLEQRMRQQADEIHDFDLTYLASISNGGGSATGGGTTFDEVRSDTVRVALLVIGT